EQHDLSMEQPTRVAAFAEDALRFYRANQVYFLTAPTLAEEEVHHRLLKDAEVAVLSEDGTHERCRRDELTFTCPGQGDDVTVRLKSRRVDGRVSECVDVRLPSPQQQIELVLKGETLALLSGARVGVPDKERKKKAAGEVRIAVEVD